MAREHGPAAPPEPDAESGVVTLVLRLLRRPLGSGELVGRGEVIGTGASGDVRSADDVVRLAAGQRDAQPLSLGRRDSA